MTMKNQIKTTLLLGALTGIFLLIGSFWGQGGLLIAIIFAGGMNFVSYWWSSKIVLWMYRAKEADKKQYGHLYSMIKDIAKHAEIPMPKVYIVNTPQANAFATGRNPTNAVVAVTTGILQVLNDKELKGVLAHELGHVKNRDILISSIAAMIAGVISYIAMVARWSAIFGGFGSDRERGNNLIGFVVLAILAPLMAMIIQLAISRSREYLADETGARIVKDGKPLARALEKIHHSTKSHPLHFGAEAGSSLFIENPFKANALFNLFSTHPPVNKRVERLNSMKF